MKYIYLPISDLWLRQWTFWFRKRTRNVLTDWMTASFTENTRFNEVSKAVFDTKRRLEARHYLKAYKKHNPYCDWATDWTVKVRIPGRNKRFFSSAGRPDALCFPRQWAQAFFPMPGNEADHSHSSSAEIKNEWNYSCAFCLSHYGFDRENFTIFI